MSKRYKILQKKVQELEAKLRPAETENLNLNRERIQQRFEFLKNLLSAEIASSRPSKHTHLLHIGKRLTELEIAFRDGNNNNLNQYYSHVGENIIHHDFNTPSSSPSVCSSDVSSELGNCSEDDDDDDNNPRALVKVKVQSNDDFIISSCDEEVEVQNSPRPVKKKEEGKISSLGKYCGALIIGTFLGMILMGAAVAIVGDYGFSYSPPPRQSFTFYT